MATNALRDIHEVHSNTRPIMTSTDVLCVQFYSRPEVVLSLESFELNCVCKCYVYN